MTTISEAIDGYVKLRNKKNELARKHKDELEPINKKMDTIEAWLKREFDKQGVTQQKSASGSVAFVQGADSCTCTDKEAFLEFVKENEAFELMDVRPSKTVVRAFMEERGEIPPGVKFTQYDVIRVRS